jgi:hypothetical protein
VVIAAKNREVFGMHWSRREFLEATVEALSWEAASLDTDWRTRTVKRFISDVQLADFDSDGREELLISLIVHAGELVLTSAKSTVIAYELEAVPGAASATTSVQ